MRYEKNRFIEIISISKTLSDVARMLNLEPSKGNRDTIKKYIDEYNLDIEHFGYLSGNSNNFIKKDTNDILNNKVTYSNTGNLKKRLYKEGLKNRECELCGQNEEWFGKSISLILDHINGNNTDNRLENLRILCPNCNASLETHCSKNKTKYRDYLVGIKYNCTDCNVEVSKKSIRCVKCESLKQRKVERPDIETLLKEVDELGYKGTGRKYGVSDNAIRKWIKNAGVV
jgi:hypothetical protein